MTFKKHLSPHFCTTLNESIKHRYIRLPIFDYFRICLNTSAAIAHLLKQKKQRYTALISPQNSNYKVPQRFYFNIVI